MAVLTSYEENEALMQNVMKHLKDFDPAKDTIEVTGSLQGSDWEATVTLKARRKTPLIIIAHYSTSTHMEPWNSHGDPMSFVRNQLKLPEEVTDTTAWVQALGMRTFGDYPSGFHQFQMALKTIEAQYKQFCQTAGAKAVTDKFR